MRPDVTPGTATAYTLLPFALLLALLAWIYSLTAQHPPDHHPHPSPTSTPTPAR
ncbi:hypothetical protein [Kitasatospora sp. NBC_01300]|uniref:hypothetical protein n=1 Tax=Kitasatospora sp. NBC_01300 TaxID=2903574 RepID=UPI00352F4E9D|nr:hypothetical protein OG556_07540 [Kitasatospora sp. NBC_01300]